MRGRWLTAARWWTWTRPSGGESFISGQTFVVVSVAVLANGRLKNLCWRDDFFNPLQHGVPLDSMMPVSFLVGVVCMVFNRVCVY